MQRQRITHSGGQRERQQDVRTPLGSHSQLCPKAMALRHSSKRVQDGVWVCCQPLLVQRCCCFSCCCPCCHQINKYAFSGGGATLEEHRTNGANLDVDVPWKYLNFFMEDDGKLTAIGREYGAGRMLTGEWCWCRAAWEVCQRADVSPVAVLLGQSMYQGRNAVLTLAC